MSDQLSKAFRSELKDHILPFWRNLQDTEYGGFYGLVDADLKIHKDANKTSIGTARLLWSFSRAYGLLGNKADLAMAKHAYTYMMEALFDKVNGGFNSEVSYKNNLISTTKHTIFQAYAIYGMSEYFKICEEADVKNSAIHLYQLMEAKLFDEARGGTYTETSDAKWQSKPIEIGRKEGIEFDQTGVCYLHILEAYTNLYRIWPDEGLKDKLVWLLTLFRDKIIQNAHGSFGIYFDTKWQLVADEFCFGRDIEATWLIDDAMAVTGYEDKVLTAQLLTIADHVYGKAITKMVPFSLDLVMVLLTKTFGGMLTMKQSLASIILIVRLVMRNI